MKKTGKTATTLVIFLSSVVFFLEYVTCPSTSSSEKVEMLNQLSRVIVRHKASGIVHVYKNAALYAIRRPIYITETFPNLKWFTIRVRKSQEENFRTLADMSGREVELLYFTDNIVKMIFNEDYEYTLHFHMSYWADYFVNSVWRPSRKTGKKVEYGLKAALVLEDSHKRELIEKATKFVQRTMPNKVNVYYVQSSERKIGFILSSRHFLIEITASNAVQITAVDVRDHELHYKYRLVFSDESAAYSFYSSARNDQYGRGNARFSEPQDTGNSDDSITHDGTFLYDEDELKCFHDTEASTDWTIRDWYY